MYKSKILARIWWLSKNSKHVLTTMKENLSITITRYWRSEVGRRWWKSGILPNYTGQNIQWVRLKAFGIAGLDQGLDFLASRRYHWRTVFSFLVGWICLNRRWNKFQEDFKTHRACWSGTGRLGRLIQDRFVGKGNFTQLSSTEAKFITWEILNFVAKASGYTVSKLPGMPWWQQIFLNIFLQLKISLSSMF